MIKQCKGNYFVIFYKFLNIFLRIAVHSREEIVDTEVSHQDAQEAENHIEMIRARASQPRQALRVQGDGVEHEGDERPRFLRVPAPVVAPTDIRPHGA